jgi:hypothetical protein
MHSQSKAAAPADVERYFETATYGHADNLVLQSYGEGFAWLRPEPAVDDDPRYVLTQKGRDDLRRAEALERMLGPWPRVSKVLDAESVA